MTNEIEQLWESIKKEETALIATSAEGRVTMRTVSPVYYRDAILIFTDTTSQKYRQLTDNPSCCVAIGGCFVEARAEFCGETMLDRNKPLREVYSEKFADVFDESVAFGGRSAEFILLKPTHVSGWGFENGVPTGPFECFF